MRIYIKENGKTRINLRIPSAFLTSPTLWRMYLYFTKKELSGINSLKEDEDEIEYNEGIEEMIEKNKNINQVKISKETATNIGKTFKRLKKKHKKFVLVEILDEDTEVLITL